MAEHPRIKVTTELDDMCFGCGQSNPIGLRLKFRKEGDIVKTEVTPYKYFQGWPGILHGGIIASILDEAMAWAARLEGFNCVTARMQMSFKRPIPIAEKLVVTGRITKRDSRLIGTEAEIMLEDGTVMAQGSATQAVLSVQPPPGSRLEAAIWDMDGVIVDSAQYHFQAWQESFQKREVEYSEEEFRKHFGQRNDAIISDVFKGKVTPEDMETISQEKEERYRTLITGSIKALPGAKELLGVLKEKGVKLALASSAPKQNIILINETLGIDTWFQAVVSGEEVTWGKPDPQVFILAAQKLGIAPAGCCVLEDAVAGVSAAKRAGMKCVAVTTTNLRESLKEADLVVDTLEKVNVEDMERLFAPPSPRGKS